jgi:predicted ATPase
MTFYRQGAFLSAREHLEQTVALYQPHAHFPQAFRHGGADPGVGARCFLAWTLWPLGYPDQALQRIHEAITLAQERAHPFSVAWALNFAAWVHKLRRERQATQEHAEAAVTLAMEHEFKQMVALGSILRGTALGELGADDEGLVQIRQGLEAWRSVGAEDGRPHFLAMLAEACGRAGQEEEGLNLVTEALTIVHRTGEAHYEAELYRLYGELSLRFSDSSPEESFQRAIDIARHQGAKSWELRAALSLGRLWHGQGKKKAARQMLTEIFAWFTEGLETSDLQEAALLLKEWS